MSHKKTLTQPTQKIFRHLSCCILACLTTAFCLSAYARSDCFLIGDARTSQVTVQFPDRLTIPVNSNRSVGDVLWSSGWVPGSNHAVRSHCRNQTHVSWTYSATMKPTSIRNVYETGVAGIGIRAYVNDDLERVLGRTPLAASAVSYGPQKGNGLVQLIYLGPVQSGRLNLSGVLGEERYSTTTTTRITIANTTEVIGGSCQVITPQVFVPMPTASIKNFSHPGSSFGKTAFTLRLECNSAVGIHITLTDASKQGNTGDVLSLTPDSTARGIGYQIKYNSSAVRYGPDSSAPGTINQIAVGNATSKSTIALPFTVEYIRTDTVRPGSANAIATFTMSYQ